MGNTVEVLNGVRNWYGPRSSEDQLPSVVVTKGSTKEMVIDFTFASLPVASADGAMVLTIPAHALIVKATLMIDTAFLDGTSYVLGLSTTAGVAIDADGLLTAAQLPVANMTADTAIVGTGALVGTMIGADAGQVVMTATGTFTAGTAKLVIEYVEQ